jgi:glycosyltransferase involved in cell wall biosynthesis
MNSEPKPLVSVVLCFFNEERFLREAVNSVIAQHYTNWELILVDDGSTDGSVRIAKAYAEQYPQIHYIDHPRHVNRGLSASRNAGIRKSQGDFIAFIDADDIWLPNKISDQLNIFRKHSDVTVAMSAALYWNSWASTDKPDVAVQVGVAEGVYNPPELAEALYPLGKGSAPCPSTMMIKREVTTRYLFEETFRDEYQLYEDQGFLGKVYLHEKVFVSSSCLIKYRLRPTSIVASVTANGRYDLVRSYYLQWYAVYLKSQKAPKKIWSLLENARAPYLQPLWYKMQVTYPRQVKNYAARCMVKLGLLNYTKT